MDAELSAKPLTTNSRPKCVGVPAYGGWPARSCDNDRPPDAFLRCHPCDVEIERRQEATRNAAHESGVRKLLQAAGLSRPYIDGAKSFTSVEIITPNHGRAIVELKKVLDGDVAGVLLRGDRGTGKTDLLEATIQAAIMRGRNARFANFRSLLGRITATFKDSSELTQEAVISEFADAWLLGLDDLGVTKPSRFNSDVLYEIFERRARNQRPTIITTNYSKPELIARLIPVDGGDELDATRIVDRIVELCPVEIEFRGPSFRRQVHDREVIGADAN